MYQKAVECGFQNESLGLSASQFSEVLIKKSSVPASVLLEVHPGHLHFKIVLWVIHRHYNFCKGWKPVRDKKNDLMGN